MLDEKRRAPWLILAAVLLSLGLLSVAGLLIIWWTGPPKANTMNFEVAKALMQLVGVAVVGTAVSLATFNYQWSRDHNRELQQRRDELLHSLLNDTLTSYNAVKRSRRLLRAKLGATIATGRVDLKTYDEQLAIIATSNLSSNA